MLWWGHRTRRPSWACLSVDRMTGASPDLVFGLNLLFVISRFGSVPGILRCLWAFCFVLLCSLRHRARLLIVW
jgi:hypothetical protein